MNSSKKEKIINSSISNQPYNIWKSYVDKDLRNVTPNISKKHAIIDGDKKGKSNKLRDITNIKTSEDYPLSKRENNNSKLATISTKGLTKNAVSIIDFHPVGAMSSSSLDIDFAPYNDSNSNKSNKTCSNERLITTPFLKRRQYRADTHIDTFSSFSSSSSTMIPNAPPSYHNERLCHPSKLYAYDNTDISTVFNVGIPDESLWARLHEILLEEGCVACPEDVFVSETTCRSRNSTTNDTNDCLSDYVFLKCIQWGCYHVAHHHCVPALMQSSSSCELLHAFVSIARRVTGEENPSSLVARREEKEIVDRSDDHRIHSAFVLVQLKHIASSRILTSMHTRCDVVYDNDEDNNENNNNNNNSFTKPTSTPASAAVKVVMNGGRIILNTDNCDLPRSLPHFRFKLCVSATPKHHPSVSNNESGDKSDIRTADLDNDVSKVCAEYAIDCCCILRDTNSKLESNNTSKKLDRNLYSVVLNDFQSGMGAKVFISAENNLSNTTTSTTTDDNNNNLNNFTKDYNNIIRKKKERIFCNIESIELSFLKRESVCSSPCSLGDSTSNFTRYQSSDSQSNQSLMNCSIVNNSYSSSSNKSRYISDSTFDMNVSPVSSFPDGIVNIADDVISSGVPTGGTWSPLIKDEDFYSHNNKDNNINNNINNNNSIVCSSASNPLFYHYLSPADVSLRNTRSDDINNNSNSYNSKNHYDSYNKSLISVISSPSNLNDVEFHNNNNNNNNAGALRPRINKKIMFASTVGSDDPLGTTTSTGTGTYTSSNDNDTSGFPLLTYRIAGLQPGQNISSYISTFSGSRAIQSELDKDPGISTTLSSIFLRNNDLSRLVSDKYANYAIQKLFEMAPPRTKLVMVDSIHRDIPRLARSLQGSLCLQSMMNASKDCGEIALMFATSLATDVSALMVHDNGTYVIQRCIETFTPRINAAMLTKILEDLLPHHHHHHSSSSVTYTNDDTSNRKNCTNKSNATHPSIRNENWAMVIRLVMDTCCAGIRYATVHLLTQQSIYFSKHEIAHLVVLHILLPLMNTSALETSANHISSNCDCAMNECSFCACEAVLYRGSVPRSTADQGSGALGCGSSSTLIQYLSDIIPSVSHRKCCCIDNINAACQFVGHEPAMSLLDALSHDFSNICLNRWGKKIIQRFCNLDNELNVESVLYHLLGLITRNDIIVLLLNDRRGVNCIVQLCNETFSSKYPKLREILFDRLKLVFTKTNNNNNNNNISLVSSNGYLNSCCLGVRHSKLQSLIAIEIGTDSHRLPQYIPLSLMGVHSYSILNALREVLDCMCDNVDEASTTSPSVNASSKEALDVVAISRSDMDVWKSWFPMCYNITTKQHNK